jgi:hypothetical protein
LLRESPNVLRIPALGVKVLVTAMTVILPCQASCLRC